MNSRQTKGPTRTSDGRVHTLIIGAGPSGLAAATELVRGGIAPLIVEREEVPGGLMRSVRHGDYIVDLGRKEMYSRISEVDAYWRDLLGADYRPYQHRVGSLYRGRVLELSSVHRGIRRGIPYPWLVAGGLDLARAWALAPFRTPATYADFWYRRVGERFARMLAQGYWEKFKGQRWVDMPVPSRTSKSDAAGDSYSNRAILAAARLAGESEADKVQWHHPAHGMGQISERIVERLGRAGVGVDYRAEVGELRLGAGRIEAIELDRDGVRSTIKADHIISSMSIEELDVRLVGGRSEAETPGGPPPDAVSTIVLVYLFLSEPSPFPHAWLEINDPDMRSGRITNYAGFGGDMVPEGRGCVCVEFFAFGEDALTEMTRSQLQDLAITACTNNGLIDRAHIDDVLVTTMERTNASTSWRDWQTTYREGALQRISGVEGLFYVNRNGTDRATHAGMLAARAVLDGSRTTFDELADPTRNII